MRWWRSSARMVSLRSRKSIGSPGPASLLTHAWDRLISAITAARRGHGLDVFIGRRLPGMLRAAGLVDIGVKAVAPIWRPGDLYQTLLVVFAEIHKEKIVARGLLDEKELTGLAETLRAHLNHPDTIVVYSLLFQPWGRKPVR